MLAMAEHTKPGCFDIFERSAASHSPFINHVGEGVDQSCDAYLILVLRFVFNPLGGFWLRGQALATIK
jgi:hypothetical protein